MISRKYLSQFLVLLGALLAVAAMDPPSQPIVLTPEQAVKEGRALVDEMLSMKPEANKTTGTMSIRNSKGFVQFPIQFQTTVASSNWTSFYEAKWTNRTEVISIIHTGQSNIYFSREHQLSAGVPVGSLPTPLSGQATFAPFATSDFSIADLGLEFLHWPEQRLLQKEMKRSRSCRVLESINPHPVKGGYSKVKSWVDAESDGIVYALAYDEKGRELKEFIPKDFSKVNGQWQLEEMQISNLQTDSRTTVKFNLAK